jgi:hypothetical protein
MQLTLGMLRRDPAVRVLPRWLLIGAGATSVTMLALGVLVARAGSGVLADETTWTLFLGTTVWLAVALFLAFGRTTRRCSRLDMSLPLTARRLWVTHLAAVVLSACAVGAVALAVLEAHFLTLGWASGGRLDPSVGLGGVPRALLAGVLLSAVVLQMPRPELRSVPSGRGHGWLVALTVLGLLVMTVGVALAPPALALVPIALAVVLGLRTWRSLPAAFDLVPREPKDGKRADRPEADSSWNRPTPTRGGWGERLALQLSLVRVLARGMAPGQLVRLPMLYAQIPFLLLWGMFISGLLIPEAELRFTFIVLTAYVLVSFVAAPLSQMHVLDPLPVSRRWLFAVLVFPCLVALGLGYGAGRVGGALVQGPPVLVAYGTEPDGLLVPPYRSKLPQVRVPVESCRIAWDGRPAPIDSPWGESHAPWSIPLYRGSTAVLYSPFAPGEEASKEFMALQLGRATEAVYGSSIAPEAMRESLVDAFAGEPLDVRDAFPGLDTPREGPVLPVLLLAIGLCWLVMLRIYLKTYRAGVSDGRRRAVFLTILVVAVALHIAQFAVGLTGLTKLWVVTGLPRMIVRLVADALPGGEIATWLACAALFWAAYLVVRARFERIEAPVPSVRADA